MNILHIIYDDIKNPFLGGGGSYATFEINKRLAKKNNVTVLTANYPNARDEIIEGVKYKRVGKGKGAVQSRVSYILNIGKTIKKEKFDILIDDFSPYSPSFSFLFTKKPIIVSIRYNFIFKHVFKRFNILAVFFYLFNKLLRFYDNFMVYSETVKPIIEKYGNVRFFKRGINVKEFKDLKEENYILSLGRISFLEKGFDILLRAFKKANLKTKLIIAGDGCEQEVKKVRNLIKELKLNNVEMAGRVGGKKKIDLLGHCLFVIMASRYEHSPAVAREAAASGKCLIGTNVSGIKDFIKNNYNGLLVRNSDELANAMIKLFNDKKLRNRLDSNNKKLVKEYDWDSIVSEQEKYYLEILSKK